LTVAGLDAAIGTAENYRRFAVHVAAGRSPSYEQLALAVAGDDLVLSFLSGSRWPNGSPTFFSGLPVTCWVLQQSGIENEVPIRSSLSTTVGGQ
jgi:hypothetical protein